MMLCGICFHILSTLLLVTWVSATESEVCQEINLHSHQFQHSSVFIRDAAGNPAEITSVELLEQLSTSPCVRWESFAHYESIIIVKDGCQGKFNVCYTAGVPRPSVPITQSEDCVSVRLLSKIREPAEKMIVRSDGRGDLIVSMTLTQSLSAVSCVPGLSYSYYGHKVETKFGCKGDFIVCLDPLIILEPDLPKLRVFTFMCEDYKHVLQVAVKLQSSNKLGINLGPQHDPKMFPEVDVFGRNAQISHPRLSGSWQEKSEEHT